MCEARDRSPRCSVRYFNVVFQRSIPFRSRPAALPRNGSPLSCQSPVHRFPIMPPQRIRNGFDDSRSEASSTRDKQAAYTGMSKGRRNGTSTLVGSNLKDVTNAQTTPSGQQEDAAVSVNVIYGLRSNDYAKL